MEICLKQSLHSTNNYNKKKFRKTGISFFMMALLSTNIVKILSKYSIRIFLQPQYMDFIMENRLSNVGV